MQKEAANVFKERLKAWNFPWRTLWCMNQLMQIGGGYTNQAGILVLDTCFEINDCFCEGHELVLVKILWWIIYSISEKYMCMVGGELVRVRSLSLTEILLDFWIEGLGKKHSTIFDLYLKVPVFLMFITDLYLYLYTMNILSLSTIMLCNSITSVGCKELISMPPFLIGQKQY